MSSASDIQHVLLLYLAAGLLVAALATNGWVIDNRISFLDMHGGLFKACSLGACGEYRGNKGVKALEILGFIAALLCAILMTIHYAVKNKSDKMIKSLPQATFFLSIAGAGLVILGCVIFGFDHYGTDVYPSYSFVMAIVGAIVLVAGGSASAKK